MKDIKELKQIANENRKKIIEIVYLAKAGHPGGSLSCIDFLTAIYENYVRLDKTPRSKVILSKGHAVPAQYAILHGKGIIGDEELKTFRKVNSRLQGHPHMVDVPEVDATTGLLGQGLSLGVGVALAKKANGDPNPVFVIVGDGELAEGQIWESVLQAAQYHLNNLVMILDSNKLSSSGPVKDVLNIEPIAAKFEAFHWKTYEIGGHDMEEILDTLEKARNESSKPVAIIANTVKGKGVSFMENNPKWHSGAISDEEYKTAMEDLDRWGGSGPRGEDPDRTGGMTDE
ncbi:MAG TPA: transketolase [Anaerovoracaceae bacterium]|nr:transketolase [Anaerovoracaceae bacterium]